MYKTDKSRMLSAYDVKLIRHEPYPPVCLKIRKLINRAKSVYSIKRSKNYFVDVCIFCQNIFVRYKKVNNVIFPSQKKNVIKKQLREFIRKKKSSYGLDKRLEHFQKNVKAKKN